MAKGKQAGKAGNGAELSRLPFSLTRSPTGGTWVVPISL
jgi:hypothetical protein